MSIVPTLRDLARARKTSKRKHVCTQGTDNIVEKNLTHSINIDQAPYCVSRIVIGPGDALVGMYGKTFALTGLHGNR